MLVPKIVRSKDRVGIKIDHKFNNEINAEELAGYLRITFDKVIGDTWYSFLIDDITKRINTDSFYFDVIERKDRTRLLYITRKRILCELLYKGYNRDLAQQVIDKNERWCDIVLYFRLSFMLHPTT